MRRLWPLMLILWVFPSVFSQNNILGNLGFKLNFNPPGGRAMALGGAFVAVADDTTAVLFNPAGLAFLDGHAAMFEYRSIQQKNTHPIHSGTITQIDRHDFTYDIEARDFSKTVSNLNFAAYRGEINEHWRFALMMHKMADQSLKFDGNPVVFHDIRIPFGSQYLLADFAYPRNENEMDLNIDQFGGAIAYGNGNFAIGFTLLYGQMDYMLKSDLYGFGDAPPPSDDLGNPQYYQEYLGTTLAQGNDSDFGGVLGLLYLSNSGKWQIGASYTLSPEYTYTGTEILSDGIANPDFEGENALFKIPDVMSMGGTYFFTEQFFLTMEYRFIEYSQLSDNLLNFLPDDAVGHGQIYNDAHEIHAGLSYTFIKQGIPYIFRFGYYKEPYHKLLNTNGDNNFIYHRPESVFDVEIRPSVFMQQFEEDLNHMTVGFGGTFADGDVQWDVGYDYSKGDTQWSLSLIWRFGGEQ